MIVKTAQSGKGEDLKKNKYINLCNPRMKNGCRMDQEQGKEVSNVLGNMLEGNGHQKKRKKENQPATTGVKSVTCQTESKRVKNPTGREFFI